MSESPGPAWEFGDTALTVLPDISWEEFETLWGTVQGLHRGVNWFMGDALLAGEKIFGERYAQLVDGYAVELRNQARWVASRFPPARRRVSIAWSLFRECAALEPKLQDELLDQAEKEGWHTKDMIAARKRTQEEQARAKSDYPRNGGPQVGDEDPPLDVGEGNEQPGAGAEPEAIVQKTGIDAVAGAAPQSDGGGRTGGSIPPTGASDIEELRACIAALKSPPATSDRGAWAERLNVLIANRLSLSVCKDWVYEVPALDFIPAGWQMQVVGTPGSVWTVELRRTDGSERRAIGDNTILAAAIVEAALAARISEASA